MTEHCKLCKCVVTHDDDILAQDLYACPPSPHCLSVCAVCAQELIFAAIGEPVPAISRLINGR